MLLFPPTPRGGHRPGQGGAALPGTWKEFLSPGWGAGGRRESVGEGGGPLSCRSQGCRGRAKRGQGWEPLPWSARGRLVDPGARALEVGVGQQGPLPVLGLSPVGLGTAQSLLLGLLVRLKPRGQSLGAEPVWEVRGSASGPRGQQGWSRADQGRDAQEGRSPAQKDALLLCEVSEPPRSRAQTPWACGTSRG